MNMDHLRYLVAAVESDSYTEAARTMHVSSQAIANAVHGIENILGEKLFTPAGRNIQATPAATQAAQAANRVLAAYDDFTTCCERFEQANSTQTETQTLA